MKRRSICVMLVDDNPDDNFFHERGIKNNNADNVVLTKNSGMAALEYLKLRSGGRSHPDLIFLDINMPGMNGWEFLEEYNRLDQKLRNGTVIVILTTSENPDDVAKAKGSASVSDCIAKPLTEEIMGAIIERYFEKAF